MLEHTGDEERHGVGPKIGRQIGHANAIMPIAFAPPQGRSGGLPGHEDPRALKLVFR